MPPSERGSTRNYQKGQVLQRVVCGAWVLLQARMYLYFQALACASVRGAWVFPCGCARSRVLVRCSSRFHASSSMERSCLDPR